MIFLLTQVKRSGFSGNTEISELSKVLQGKQVKMFKKMCLMQNMLIVSSCKNTLASVQKWQFYTLCDQLITGDWARNWADLTLTPFPAPPHPPPPRLRWSQLSEQLKEVGEGMAWILKKCEKSSNWMTRPPRTFEARSVPMLKGKDLHVQRHFDVPSKKMARLPLISEVY